MAVVLPALPALEPAAFPEAPTVELAPAVPSIEPRVPLPSIVDMQPTVSVNETKRVGRAVRMVRPSGIECARRRRRPAVQARGVVCGCLRRCRGASEIRHELDNTCQSAAANAAAHDVVAGKIHEITFRPLTSPGGAWFHFGLVSPRAAVELLAGMLITFVPSVARLERPAAARDAEGCDGARRRA